MCKKLRHNADNQIFLEISKEKKNVIWDSIIHFRVKCWKLFEWSKKEETLKNQQGSGVMSNIWAQIYSLIFCFVFKNTGNETTTITFLFTLLFLHSPYADTILSLKSTQTIEVT